MSEAVSPPLDPFQLLTLTGSCQSLQEPWQAPGRDAGFGAYFAAKRQTQPPTLGRTEIFSPGSRFSICTCSLTIKRPFARARHAAVQREFSSTVLWLRGLKTGGRFTADDPLASGPCPKILPHRPPVCHRDDAHASARNCYSPPVGLRLRLGNRKS